MEERCFDLPPELWAEGVSLQYEKKFLTSGNRLMSSISSRVLASDCKDENEYLNESLLLIREYELNVEEAIDEIFYENIPELNKFKSVLRELKKSIKEVQKIPVEKRSFEEW